MAKILILGGTQWLGRTVATLALNDGHEVTCLARGVSGDFPSGVEAVVADRDEADAYAQLAGRSWDLVVELTRLPSHARAAVEALSPTAEHWAFVSSCSVYASHAKPGVTESARLLPALESGEPYTDEKYGEAKVGCEWLTVASRGNAALLVRAGLIGGPGDPSGRTTYWPLRFASGRNPVLVPDDTGDQRYVQIIDVRDLAAFILEAGLAGRGGPVNAVGAEMPLGDVLASAESAAGFHGETRAYPLASMEDDGVAPWAGPRSLPLVLPGGNDYAGFARRADKRALRWGLVRRPLAATFADVVGGEPRLDDVVPRSGLTAEQEAELIARLG